MRRSELVASAVTHCCALAATPGCKSCRAPRPTATSSAALQNLKAAMSRRTRSGLVAFVFERHLELGPIALDLAVLQLHVELRDLRHTQVAQCFPRALDRRGSGSLPGLRAGPDQLDDLVDALGHRSLLLVLGLITDRIRLPARGYRAERGGARPSPRPRYRPPASGQRARGRCRPAR